jgi:hypothetical protein
MKTLKYILIGMAIVILILVGWFGHAWLFPCPEIEIKPVVRDTIQLNSLRRMSALKMDSIKNLKQLLITYKKRYEDNKQEITIITDSVGNDHIPTVFRHLSGYYGQ